MRPESRHERAMKAGTCATPRLLAAARTAAVGLFTSIWPLTGTEKPAEKTPDTPQADRRLEQDNQLRTALIVLKSLNLASGKQPARETKKDEPKEEPAGDAARNTERTPPPRDVPAGKQ